MKSLSRQRFFSASETKRVGPQFPPGEVVVAAGLITSAVLGAAALESWQLAQDDGGVCEAQVWRAADFRQLLL